MQLAYRSCVLKPDLGLQHHVLPLQTFTFPAIYSPPIDEDLIERPLGTVFQVCNSTSGVVSAAVLILATICMSMTDWMSSAAHTTDFILLVSPYHELMILLFCLSLALLCGAVISVTWLNATQTVAIVLTTIWGSAIIVMVSMYLHISAWYRRCITCCVVIHFKFA